jgi:hypothetical protein
LRGPARELGNICAGDSTFSQQTQRFRHWYVNCIEVSFNHVADVCGLAAKNSTKKIMKIKQLLAVGGMAAALFLGAGNVFAQNDNGGGDQRPGGGMGRGNWDPAQMQQRMMDGIKDQLGFTNDTDWSAVQPLVQKVLDARREADTGARLMRSMFRNRGGNGGGDQGGGRRNRGGGMFGQPSPEEEALQKAVDDNAPTAQIKDLLAKYQASQKDKQAKLASAEENLRAVLTTKQEAQATLLGLLQ